MQKITVLILIFCVLFLFLGLMPVHGETEIYENVLRLHVLANSDSEEDQALKLQVRDAILDAARDMFAECTTRDEAETVVKENAHILEEIAMSVIKENGYDYPVSVSVGEENYPTRSYDSLCFPSGNYLSLRVIIGSGEGQNWWCVLYPPMCLSAASKCENEDYFISVGLNKDQYGIITESDKPVYNARFKILEIIQKTID